MLQKTDEQGRLLAVDAAQAVGGALLLEAASGGVEPDDGRIPLENAAVADVGRGTERAVVKPAGGEAHDGIVHAVLDVEERNDVRFALRDLLHERTVQAGAGGFGTFDGRRQLVMVAGEDGCLTEVWQRATSGTGFLKRTFSRRRTVQKFKMMLCQRRKTNAGNKIPQTI